MFYNTIIYKIYMPTNLTFAFIFRIFAERLCVLNINISVTQDRIFLTTYF